MGQETVKAVSEFIYLGCAIKSGDSSHSDILRRTALAGSVMNQLHSVWNRRSLSLELKFKLYKALVLPVLLYASETWVYTKADACRAFKLFISSINEEFLASKWYDRVTNTEVMARSHLPTVHDMICTRRLGLYGHVVRMPPAVPANAALNLLSDVSSELGPPLGWSRPRGRPPRIWTDLIENDMGLPLVDTYAVALDRDSWRAETPRLQEDT